MCLEVPLAPYPDDVTDPGSALVRGAARAAALGLLACVASVGAAVAYVRRRARGHLYAEADTPTTPVALVLGAQVYPDGRPSPFLAARLDLARRLHEAGRVQTLLVSGDGRAASYDEPAAMRAYLVAAGVPAEDVLTDGGGVDTYSSCVRAQQAYGLTRLTLVSQTYHLPRAVGTARALGLDAVGVGDHSVRGGSAWVRGVLREQPACVKAVLELRHLRS